MKNCAYPGCKHREAQYFMSRENGKKEGLVCATHDRELGRTNLMKTMPLEDAILFEHYLTETVDLTEYLDWPEWRQQHQKRLELPERTASDRLGKQLKESIKEELLDALQKATQPIIQEPKKKRGRPCLKSQVQQ